METLVESHAAKLIKQGAEARVYKTDLPPPSIITVPILLKHRFPKKYRHPTLDSSLTRQRLTSEARALMKCSKSSVKVPELLVVDLRQGVLGVEWIEGWSVREVLGGGQEDEDGPWVEEGEDEPVEATDGDQTEEERRDEEMKHRLETAGVDEDEMLGAIGAEIAKMHLCEVIHGDLTTSNMMVRLLPNASSPSPPFEVVLIDFGLSSSSIMSEERAVDLYVLERAFSSTHPVPKLESGDEGIPHFVRVLEGYGKAMEEKGKKGDWSRVEKRLDEVRLRGRKRSMVG